MPLDRAHQAGKFTAEIHLLTHIGTCPVYTFTPLADVFHGKAITLAQTLQKDGHLPCLKNSIFYMHIQRTLFYGHEGRLVLSQCSSRRVKPAPVVRFTITSGDMRHKKFG